ncbi:hypothetical protein [Haloechinothrix halophila]|uniref:hypothetical protein n=1 Tax=Haloechinothrix halophila TaxID=1069073 RepID=UPI0003F8959E|nr:hypothetical protein [Haloechinothrix halophila]
MTNDDKTTSADTTSEETTSEETTSEKATSAADKPAAAPAKSDTAAPKPDTDERPRESREPVDSIRTELEDLRDQASRRAKRSQRLSRFWATVQMLLGIASAVLALIAAGVVMSSTIDDGFAVASALVAAALVLIMTFVHPDARGANARLIARGWNTLEVDLHVFLVAEYESTMVNERKDVLRSAMARTLDLLAGRYENTESRRS